MLANNNGKIPATEALILMTDVELAQYAKMTIASLTMIIALLLTLLE